MSNSSLISYTKISPNKTSPRNHVIDTITIHCVVGQLTAEGIAGCFTSPSVQASCNYGIGRDGRIALIVEEKDRSWCSSSGSNDHRAITIECASDMTEPYAINDAVYKSLIELCADICKRNNIKELKWKADKSLIGQVDKQNMTVHRWFANKSCPGEYIYSRLGKIAKEVNEKLGVSSGSEPTPPVPVPLSFNVGDLVSIIDGAKYYTGAAVPNWVKNKKWYVKEVSGDRVIINKSEDGENAIESPIHAKYLKLVKAANEKPIVSDNVTFKAGDLVSLTSDAKYYTGATVPNWVKNKNWYVKEVSGDRVIINKSEDGENAIESPVNAKYLKLVKEKPDLPYLVRIDISNLNIRKGPGSNYATTGMYTGKGVFTIVEVSKGTGSASGWGKLKSGAGWISLDYTKKV